MSTIRTLDDPDGRPHANVFPDAEPKSVRLTLGEGESVPAHDHPDREVVFYLLTGAITLELGEETHDLSAGQVARFDGDQGIAPTAREPSTALIVLAPRADD